MIIAIDFDGTIVEPRYPSIGRKILADIYIDDRNLGGIPSWSEIYQMICPVEDKTVKPSKSWWKD